MSERKRERQSKDDSANRADGGGGNDGSSGDDRGGSRNRGRNSRRRNRKGSNRRKRNNKRPNTSSFWGDLERLPEGGRLNRITDDPAAVARSLDTPPLPGHEQSASYYFEVVYNRAVQTASALAVAGGLIDPDALLSESEDD